MPDKLGFCGEKKRIATKTLKHKIPLKYFLYMIIPVFARFVMHPKTAFLEFLTRLFHYSMKNQTTGNLL